MKNILKIISTAIIIFFIPFSSTICQDKKNEQKIKIIVNDGSGTKVMIDTVFKGNHGPDSLILKNGSVVHLKSSGEAGPHIFVMSEDNKDGRGITREMTIISSDSMEFNNDQEKVYWTDSDGHHTYKVIKSEGGNNKNWVEKDFETELDSNADKTRFVIAKDGIVVTVESADEAKAKELAKEIEKKLGVNSKED